MHIFQENTASFHKSLHSLNDLCQRLWVHITSPVKNLPALPQIQNAYFLTYSLGANAVNIETEQNNTAVFFHNQQGNRAKGATALLQDRYTVVTMASVSCSEATGIHPVRASAAHRFQIFSVPSEMLFCIPYASYCLHPLLTFMSQQGVFSQRSATFPPPLFLDP